MKIQMKVSEWWLGWCPGWLEQRIRARRYRKVVMKISVAGD